MSASDVWFDKWQVKKEVRKRQMPTGHQVVYLLKEFGKLTPTPTLHW